MSNRIFLDVDDTILTKNLILPENMQKDDNLTKQSDLVPSIIIQPAPGICVKTKTDSGEKVFLNICTSDKIPPPDDISEDELYKTFFKEGPDFVIPMSIGSEKLERDKSGNLSFTCDVAVNASYFEKCQKNESFLLFTISVIIRGVSNKFDKNLNVEDYVILKNRKVMGKLQQHKIENRKPRTHIQAKKPLIEEIQSSTTTSCEKKDKINQLENISSESYVLLKQPLEGTPTNLIGLFQMPKGVTSKEVEVFLDEDRILITVDRTNLTYDLSIPYIIRVANSKCFLDKYLKILRLDMPIESILDNIQTIKFN